MAYATVTELEAGWRDLDASERDKAETLLDRASTMVDALVDTTDISPDVLTIVVCGMVQRSMGVDTFGVSQENMTAGSYTQSYTYANPSGDMYLTKNERKMLGIGCAKLNTIKVAIHNHDGSEVEW